jgi:hypothetical protein
MRIQSVLLVIAMSASVTAGPHKVIVLPLDGNADAATKTKLNAIVQNLSKSVTGDVTNGDTTLAETASAVGCDPNKTACIDTVLTTLSVDEVIWGTATTENGQTRVVVRRATKGTPAQSQTAIIAASDQPESAEPGLAPLFGISTPITTDTGSGSAAAGSAAGSAGSASAPPPPPPPPGVPWSDQKKLGVGLAIGGGALVLLGVALWASESGVQSNIDAAPDMTPADIQNLKDLESKANGYAWGGNIAMILGLGAGGYGAYLLWKDHKEHTTVTPAPPPSGTGMTFVLRGAW